MPKWEKQIGAINLIVDDLERSKGFYRDVFGLPPQHEEDDFGIFRFKDTYVFLQHDSAHEDAPVGEVLALAEKGVGSVRDHR
jgi:catechol 2,3-dioxygenase-like lactoylglutathione lyase family enzyme